MQYRNFHLLRSGFPTPTKTRVGVLQVEKTLAGFQVQVDHFVEKTRVCFLHVKLISSWPCWKDCVIVVFPYMKPVLKFLLTNFVKLKRKGNSCWKIVFSFNSKWKSAKLRKCNTISSDISCSIYRVCKIVKQVTM